MYRIKNNAALAAATLIEFEKQAQKALFFALISVVLKVTDSNSNLISIEGLSIDLKYKFLLNGVFCGLALFYGISTLLSGLQLYGLGWPKTYKHFYTRYIYRKRNKSKENYHPIRVKNDARFICIMINVILGILGLFLIFIYAYAVKSSFSELLQVVALVFNKL